MTTNNGAQKKQKARRLPDGPCTPRARYALNRRLGSNFDASRSSS